MWPGTGLSALYMYELTSRHLSHRAGEVGHDKATLLSPGLSQ